MSTENNVPLINIFKKVINFEIISVVQKRINKNHIVQMVNPWHTKRF